MTFLCPNIAYLISLSPCKGHRETDCPLRLHFFEYPDIYRIYTSRPERPVKGKDQIRGGKKSPDQRLFLRSSISHGTSLLVGLLFVLFNGVNVFPLNTMPELHRVYGSQFLCHPSWKTAYPKIKGLIARQDKKHLIVLSSKLLRR